MRLASSFLGIDSELSSRQSKSNRVSLSLNTSKSKRKEAFKKKITADEWIADARDEGFTRVSLSLESSKSRRAANKKKMGTTELIAEDAREDMDVVGWKSTLECDDAERQGGEEFPAIHIGPYEEILAGSSSAFDNSHLVKVVKDDQKRRFANELCHALDQFVFDDQTLIKQVSDHSSIAAHPKELATSKDGVTPPISTDLDPQSIPLKKLVCGERYVCADYIDDAAEGLKDMMTGAGGCNGNEIIEYIADWDGESYDSSTYESLNTIEVRIRESLQMSGSIDSNYGTVESELSMSNCTTSTRSFDENSRDDIEVSAVEFKAVVEANTMDVETESNIVTAAATPDVEWNCSSVGSVFTEIPSSSIAEEPSIVDDIIRDSKSIEIQPSQLSNGNSCDNSEDHSAIIRKPESQMSSRQKRVPPKKNLVLKSFFSVRKAKQDSTAFVKQETNHSDPRQNADNETKDDAREESASNKSVDYSKLPDVETDSSFAGVEKSVKSNILNHVVVIQASSEESVPMEFEETANASNLDKQERAEIYEESTSQCVNTITKSNAEDGKLAGNGVQGHKELDQMNEPVAIEMKISEESESSNISQRMNEFCSEGTGDVDTFLQFDTNSSYPYESASMLSEQSENSLLESNGKEVSPSERPSFGPLSGRCSESDSSGVGGAILSSTIPAYARPKVDTITAQWTKSIRDGEKLREAALLSTVPAYTKAKVEKGTAQWIQNIDWDSFLNENMESKSLGGMSPAASKAVVLSQSERKLPTTASMVKSFFAKTKKKRYYDKMGDQAKHVSFVP